MEPAFSRMDFSRMLNLSFEAPDTDTFRALPLAYEAGRRGSTFPCVMNAANEVGVQAFIDGHIGFDDMFNTVESVLEKHSGLPHPELEDYVEADQWARSAAKEYIDKAVKQ